MKWILVLAVMVVGALQPVQAGMNANLRRFLAHPLQSAAVNMWVGAVLIALVLLVVRVPPPAMSSLRNAPTWSLFGGVIGATLVTTMLIAAPRLGALLLVAAFLTGQLTSSTVLDHFGGAGYDVRPANPGRLVGLALLAGGLVLIERSS